MDRNKHHTLRPADPAVLAQWPLSRRVGDKLDPACEALRRLALRSSDPVSGEQLDALLAAGVKSAAELIARARTSGSGQLDLVRAAVGARARLFDEIDSARAADRGPLGSALPSARCVLTGDSETSFVKPDQTARQLFGDSARMPVGPAVPAQLSQEVA